MKKFLISLLFLAGCATDSGLKTLEAKHLPGECLKLTPEAIATQFVGKEQQAAQLVINVIAVGKDQYVIAQYFMGMPVGVGAVKAVDLDKDTVEMECPAYLKPKAPESKPEDPDSDIMLKKN